MNCRANVCLKHTARVCEVLILLEYAKVNFLENWQRLINYIEEFHLILDCAQEETLVHLQHLEQRALGNLCTSSWLFNSPCPATRPGRPSLTAPGSSLSWWSRQWLSILQLPTHCMLLENTGGVYDQHERYMNFLIALGFLNSSMMTSWTWWPVSPVRSYQSMQNKR